jgi:hypothetical protein
MDGQTQLLIRWQIYGAGRKTQYAGAALKAIILGDCTRVVGIFSILR